MRPSLRPWIAIAVGGVAVVGLTGFVHVAAPEAKLTVPAPDQTITYELSGDGPTTREVRYGDVASLFYSPWAATSLERVSLPWTLTVPLTAPQSTHDLQAWAAHQDSAITCTVRRNGQIIISETARGGAFCDVPPG